VDIKTEIKRRRTFAIISHPDAGKTTLTEKLLLMGGAIQVAGAVKSNKIRKTATSDFLEIERQRGISVATSVMTLDYKDKRVNILDTPGHKDFAEDTYRTLTAVDSVILVIDSVKGVEDQTRKLMEVCRMRAIPVMVFINKMDREGKDPFDLLAELENELNIATCPFTWPIGEGSRFKGVYHLYRKDTRLYDPQKTLKSTELLNTKDLNNPELCRIVGQNLINKLNEDLDLIPGLFESYNLTLYREGYLAPVFFGSALNSFGVPELFDSFVEIAPGPAALKTVERIVQPDEDKFSGFVFKIHANLDPNHRNRMAFLRISSGRFERNKIYYHCRLGKNMRFSAPATFIANSKSTVDEAFPGDVIGLYDNGNLKIGDALTEGEILNFKGIPNFAPEILKEVVNADPMKTKQFEKGLSQLTDEGLAQLFVQEQGSRKIIGTVGELQFDVIQFRLEKEYGATCRFQALPYAKACWFSSDNRAQLEEFSKRKAAHIVYDKNNRAVFMAESDWMLNNSRETFPDICFTMSSEFNI
jgi:peptide chain release factor 3